ncbi:MAG: ABC transporter ATP-binding protein [Pseudomonadota bacterium]|nr:MAG: ABC transporter ATP-binding protein [Pseudomonadota bacterium]
MSRNRNDVQGERPLGFAIIRRLFSYTNRHAALRNVLFALVILRAAQLPALAWGVARVISGPIASADFGGAALWIAGFLAFAAVTELCFVYRMRCALLLGERVVQDLRAEIYAHLLRMPMAFFRRTEVGSLIARVTSDVDAVRTGVQDVAFVTTVQAGNLLVSAALMLYYDWQLFLVVLAMAPILWMLVRYFRKKLSEAYRAQQESFSRVTATLAESVQGIREIQGFVRQDVNGGLFRQLIFDHSKYNMGAAQKSAVFQPLLEFNGQLFLAILLVIGGHQALVRAVDLEALIQFFFLSTAFFAAIPMIGMQYNQALTAMAGAERVFRLLDTPPDWEDAPDARELPDIRGRVEFVGVGFEYEPGRPALTDVSFVAEPGRMVALVGPTGSGKSTLVNLVAKLALPSAGEVLIDGVDVRAIRSDSLHRQIACVTQENFLFTGSVLENVRLGRPSATDEEVRAAARALDVLDVLESMPRGFLTEVGERGSGLSLGQRQIVCFVRALIADPRIVILDEATSAVDSVTEARIQRALARLLAGRTSFVVAHRLSTIQKADLVLVLDGGRIVERGTHAELVRCSGRYSALYRKFAATLDTAQTTPEAPR